MLDPVSNLIYTILQLYFYVVIIWTVMSMLISFNIINRSQPIVAKAFQILEQLVEPVLRHIRKYLPAMNGMDFSPLVLILAIRFLQYTLVYISTRLTLGMP